MGGWGGAVAAAAATVVITKRLLNLVQQISHKAFVPFNIVEFRAMTLRSSALSSVGSRCVAATRHTSDTSAPPFRVIDRPLILPLVT